MGGLRDILRRAARAVRTAADDARALFVRGRRARRMPGEPRPTPARPAMPRPAPAAGVSRRRSWGGERWTETAGRAWRALERSTGITAGVVAMLLAVTGWAAASRFLKIPAANVTVARADALIDPGLAAQALGDLADMSYFSLPETAITKALRASQPNVARVEFDRIFPDGLTVTVSSYPAAFRVREGNVDGALTSNGVLVLKPMAAKGLPELRIERTDGAPTERAFNYRQLLDPADARRATDFSAALAAAFSGTSAARVTFFPQERELHAEVGTGRTVLLFDADADFSKPLRALAFYAAKKGDPLAKGAWAYADLRVPDRIFWCPADQARDCRKNLVGIYGDAYAPEKATTGTGMVKR